MSWVALDDFLKVLEMALNSNMEGVYNVIAPDEITTNCFLRGVKKTSFGFPLPEFVLKKMLGEQIFAHFSKNLKVMPTRLNELGFSFQHPTLQAFCDDILQPSQK